MKHPATNPDNSLLGCYQQGVKMPYEANRGFKINGIWYDKMDFLK